MLISNTKTVCIDFDDTIYDVENGNIIAGVREALLAIEEMGYEIVISSCRTNIKLLNGNDDIIIRHIEFMRRILQAHNIPYDRIDQGREGKVNAKFYIDDRAIRFKRNEGWEPVIDLIRSLS